MGLLPGAWIPLAIVLAAVLLCFVVALSLLLAVPLVELSMCCVEKTNKYHRKVTGHKGPHAVWLRAGFWYIIYMISFVVLFIYCFIGPYLNLISMMKEVIS